MAYRIRDTAQVGYTISGLLRVFGVRYLEDTGWGCPIPSYNSQSNRAVITTPFGSLTVGVSKLEGTLWCAGEISNPDPRISVYWTLAGATSSPIDSGGYEISKSRAAYCTEEGGSTWYCCESYTLEIPFSLTMTAAIAGYMDIQQLDRSKMRCYCAYSDGTDNLCGELWCQYSTSLDACGILPQKGFCWLESADDPDINYTLTVGDDSRSGSFAFGTKIYNPGGCSVSLGEACDALGGDGIIGQASITAIGLGEPDIPDCTYTASDNGQTTTTISGNTLTVYRRQLPIRDDFNWFKEHTASWYINVPSYTHSYSGSPLYCDGVAVPGADCRVNEVVPYWDENTHSWSTSGLPADQPIGNFRYGGSWTLSRDGDGPYMVDYGNVVYDQTRLWDKGGHYGMYRTVGRCWVANPGELGQPDFPNTVESPCHNNYSDSRMLAMMPYDVMKWDALKLSVPQSKMAHDFALTTTAQSSDYSQEVDLTSRNISVWGARFLTLHFTSSDPDHSPISVRIDGRTYSGITPANNIIDVLCPDEFVGSGNSNSLIAAIQPQNATPGNSAPSDLGVYKLNKVEFLNLKANCSYTFSALETYHPQDGSFVAVVLPEASWQDRDPEGDVFACAYAGQPNTGQKTWYQSCGLVFCDGALAGELIITRFDRKANQNCGDGSTGWRWFVSPVGCSDAKFACYRGEVSGLLTATPLASRDDDLMGYLNPGVYYGQWNGSTHEIVLTATVRVGYLEVPANWGDEGLLLEKYFNGLAAVRIIDPSHNYQPKTINVTSGAKTVSVVTDKYGFGLTAGGGGETKSLSQANPATATVNGVQASTPIKNRKCSIVTIKGSPPQDLWPRYCADTGMPVLNSAGTPSLECC